MDGKMFFNKRYLLVFVLVLLFVSLAGLAMAATDNIDFMGTVGFSVASGEEVMEHTDYIPTPFPSGGTVPSGGKDKFVCHGACGYFDFRYTPPSGVPDETIHLGTLKPGLVRIIGPILHDNPGDERRTKIVKTSPTSEEELCDEGMVVSDVCEYTASSGSTVEIQFEDSVAIRGVEYYNNWYFGGARMAEQGSVTRGGDCDPGYAVAGIQYFQYNPSDYGWGDGDGLHCKEIGGSGEKYYNWYSGGTRGSEQGTYGTGMGDCPTGQFVVGLQYFGLPGVHSDATDNIGIYCKEIGGSNEYKFNWVNNPSDPRDPEQGVQGQGTGMGVCPPEMVVVGIQYFDGISGFSDAIDGFGVHCRTVWDWE
jgi:hypothetical protein